MAELDWGLGSYEHTAAQLASSSERVLDAARIEPGERVLDVACGTGNAALAAAARGAAVTGLDGAPRLLEVAADRAREAGVHAEWIHGDAGAALPFADGAFDAALSVFGVIFASDAPRAAAELDRVVRPGGRIVLTAWVDRGPLAAVMKASMAAAAEFAPAGAPPAPPRTDWSDADTLARLFGVRVCIEEHEMPFVAASPRAYVDEHTEHHPAWLSLNRALPAERYAALEDELVSILETANEDPDALRVSSPYVMVRIER